MKPKTIYLAVLYTVAFTASLLLDALPQSPPLQLSLTMANTLAQSFLFFGWAYHDSAERGYRRSWLLNIGIIGASIIVLPLYLLRSRPRGRRLRALGMLMLAALLYVGAAVAGSLCAGLLQPSA